MTRRDLMTAFAWSMAAGVIVGGTNPRVVLGAAAVFLLVPPLGLLFHAAAFAERAARTAFYLLTVGVALEFRYGLGQWVGRRSANKSPE